MGNRKYSEAEIITALNGRNAGQAENGTRVGPNTHLRPKAKYGGMKLSEGQRLKRLEDENRIFYQMLCMAISGGDFFDACSLADVLTGVKFIAANF